MNPVIIIAAVRAAVRLSIATDKAIAKTLINKEIYVPTLAFFDDEFEAPLDLVDDVFREATNRDENIGILEADDRYKKLKEKYNLPRLFENGDNFEPIGKEDVEDLFLEIATEIKKRENFEERSPQAFEQLVGTGYLKRWSKKDANRTTLTRLAITFVDVAAEFIGANPGLLPVGGEAEKLIGGFALHLGELIKPEDFTADAKLGWAEQLAGSLLGVSVHAALKTVSDNADLIVDEKQFGKAIKVTLAPIIKEMPSGLTDNLEYEAVFKALVGPAASALVTTIGENPAVFFGDKFGEKSPLGALTKTILLEAGKGDLKEVGTTAGAVRLLKAALELTATRPELFVKIEDDKVEAMAKDLVASIARTLKDATKIDGDLGLDIAAAALRSVAKTSAAFFDANDDWHQTAAAMVTAFVNGVADAVDQDALDKVFGKKGLTDLANVFFAQVAQRPGMVAGSGKELQGVVAAVAKALAKDSAALLTPEGVLSIAAVAAEEAARNPGRLFGFETSAVAPMLGEVIIGNILELAAQQMKNQAAAAPTGLLFGDTLKTVIVTTLRAASGNSVQMLKAMSKDGADVVDGRVNLLGMLAKIEEISRADPQEFGSRELLFIFQKLLPQVLATGTVPVPTKDDMLKLLKPTEAPAAHA